MDPLIGEWRLVSLLRRGIDINSKGISYAGVNGNMYVATMAMDRVGVKGLGNILYSGLK